MPSDRLHQPSIRPVVGFFTPKTTFLSTVSRARGICFHSHETSVRCYSLGDFFRNCLDAMSLRNFENGAIPILVLHDRCVDAISCKPQQQHLFIHNENCEIFISLRDVLCTEVNLSVNTLGA